MDLTKPENGVGTGISFVTGAIFGLVVFALHLFWKFRTANTQRAKWKTLFPVGLFPRSTETLKDATKRERFRKGLINRRNFATVYSITNARHRHIPNYPRRAA